MGNAQNHPVRRRQEMHSGDMPIEQRGAIDLSLDKELDREDIVVADASLTKADLDLQAFAEEPVTILIQKSNEKNPAIVVDCWVNGKGAEVLVNGEWHVFNCLPRGIEVTTKRKYVENIARMKIDNVTTNKVNDAPEDGRDGYKHEVSTSHAAPFSVISDKSPYARTWLTNLMRERA